RRAAGLSNDARPTPTASTDSRRRRTGRCRCPIAARQSVHGPYALTGWRCRCRSCDVVARQQWTRIADRSMGDMSASARAEPDPYVSLKSVYLAAKHLPDRMLHRRRREEARRRVLQLGRVQNILVVCYGNVCRSPYLEAVLRRALPTLNVISAGFVGPGRPVPENSLILAGQRGLNLAEFRSRAISRVNPACYDLVVVMDASQARYLTETFRVWPARIIV